MQTETRERAKKIRLIARITSNTNDTLTNELGYRGTSITRAICPIAIIPTIRPTSKLMRAE